MGIVFKFVEIVVIFGTTIMSLLYEFPRRGFIRFWSGADAALFEFPVTALTAVVTEVRLKNRPDGVYLWGETILDLKEKDLGDYWFKKFLGRYHLIVDFDKFVSSSDKLDREIFVRCP